MTINDSSWQQLRATFSVELDERVQALNDQLLQLEREAPSAEARQGLFDALFREAHSLKGAARVLDLGALEHLAHALESSLDVQRKAATAPGQPWFDVAYQATDLLTATYQALTRGAPPPAELESVISALEIGAPEEPPVAEAEPVPEPAPVEDAPAAAPEPASTVPAPSVVDAEAPPVTTPADQPAPAPAPSRASSQRAVESVRVAVPKLDALLAESGELAVAFGRAEQRLHDLRDLRQELYEWRGETRTARGLKAKLRPAVERGQGTPAQPRDVEALLHYTERIEARSDQLVEHVDRLVAHLRRDTAELGLISRTIGDHVMAVRLVTTGTIFGAFERMVRDLARDHAKEVQLVVVGAATEIDRMLLEQLRDPIMHMLRNAVDHGIEPPDERAALGKPRAGTVQLTVSQRGGTVQMILEDDGRGLDPAKLRQKAAEKGLLTAERAASLDDAAARELIFQPGFSTAAAVTDTSGRGVGMDVVRENVERLRGHVEVESTPGQGTRFTVSVPLTLATERALLVAEGPQVFAVPSSSVERTGRLRTSQVVELEGRPSIAVGGHSLPLLQLADLLEGTTATPTEATDAWRPFLVLRQGERRVALLASALVGEQEIVVKPLGWPLRRVRCVSGAAVLTSGQSVIILNPTDLLRSAWNAVTRGTSGAAPRSVETISAPRPRRVLVVDDSVTTRTLERSILEAAGYDVLVAADGVEALQVLQEEAVDLVVSDVEMPRMDGFTLTAQVRRDERLRQLPVVLVTSLGDREHRERGVAAGADAYVVKSTFDQGELLDAIGRLL